jgi:hypothetical protein
MSRAHDPLFVDHQHIVPAEFMAVSYTRHVSRPSEDGGLEAMDGAEAARRGPSAVELRLDTMNSTCFSPEEKARIVAFKPLRADRRGVVRVIFGDAETRPKNLSGARRMLADLLLEAMATPLPTPVEAKPRRGRAGLIKNAQD